MSHHCCCGHYFHPFSQRSCCLCHWLSWYTDPYLCCTFQLLDLSQDLLKILILLKIYTIYLFDFQRQYCCIFIFFAQKICICIFIFLPQSIFIFFPAKELYLCSLNHCCICLEVSLYHAMKNKSLDQESKYICIFLIFVFFFCVTKNRIFESLSCLCIFVSFFLCHKNCIFEYIFLFLPQIIFKFLLKNCIFELLFSL